MNGWRTLQGFQQSQVYSHQSSGHSAARSEIQKSLCLVKWRNDPSWHKHGSCSLTRPEQGGGEDIHLPVQILLVYRRTVKQIPKRTKNAFGPSPSDNKIRITTPIRRTLIKQSLKNLSMGDANGINSWCIRFLLQVRREIFYI